MAAKRSTDLDQEAQAWIESVSGEKFPSDISYEDALKDGIILCKLMNKLSPNSIPKIATSGGAFKLRENVAAFQNAARSYGVADSELFQTVDLFEKRNIAQVTLAIHALGRQAQKKNFKGPALGVKLSDKNERQFTNEQLRAGDGMIGLLNEGMNKEWPCDSAREVSSAFTPKESCFPQGYHEISEIADHTISAEPKFDIEPIKQVRTELVEPIHVLDAYNNNNKRHSFDLESFSEFSEYSCADSINNGSSYHEQRRSQRRNPGHRSLSRSSVNTLLKNLQLQPNPSTNINTAEEPEEENVHDSLTLLIQLARDPSLTKMGKIDRLKTSIEDTIGMVELLSLVRLVKTPTTKLSVDEAPLNIYRHLLPSFVSLILLENDSDN
ncbi:unnamed protein product [Didymodactylos carnosus]|nr:unnamed protein product [Didymodactylos carnosus]CAF3808148.1 unnamed protein product [Didymodactylos carnosus]